MLTTNGDCPICDAAAGSCNDFAKGLPVQIALEPSTLGQTTRRFFRTTERVWSADKRYLIIGPGQDITWERAIELGLVPAPPASVPLTVEPVVAEEIEVLDNVVVETTEVKPELISDEATTAAIKRRPKRKPSGKLGGVS